MSEPMDSYSALVILGLALHLNGTPENIRATARRLEPMVDRSAQSIMRYIGGSTDPVAFVRATSESVENLLDQLAEQQA
jgi:hypothetical protein